MTTVKQLTEWLNTLHDDATIGVDDDGLTIVQDGSEDEVYFEIGGMRQADCPECGRDYCKCQRIVSFRFRPNDPRDPREERQLIGYWGERDTWGKRPFRHDPNTTDETTVYAFDDEIVSDEAHQ